MSSWKVCFYFQAHQLNCQTNIYGYTHKHSHSLTLYISLSHTHNERKVMTGVSFLAMATCALLSYRCVLAILPCFIIGFFFVSCFSLTHSPRYYQGHAIQLSLRGQTVINNFVPYADDVEVFYYQNKHPCLAFLSFHLYAYLLFFIVPIYDCAMMPFMYLSFLPVSHETLLLPPPLSSITVTSATTITVYALSLSFSLSLYPSFSFISISSARMK